MSTPPPRRSSGRARWTPALRALSFFGALSLTLAAFNAWVVLSPTPTAQRGRVAMQSAMPQQVQIGVRPPSSVLAVFVTPIRSLHRTIGIHEHAPTAR